MSNSVILGVKKEEDPSENRVSIVPKDIKAINNLGLVVNVEKGAGAKAGYSDEEYNNSGATILEKLTEDTNLVTSVNAFYNKNSKFIKQFYN